MPTAKSSASKVARSRERMRSAGLRPVQFWVPDTRQASFVADLRVQCLALKGDAHEADATGFAQAATEHLEGWT